MATFGDIERAFADLYEYRFFIGAAFIIAFAAALYVAYRLGWHQFVMRHRVPFIIGGTPVAIVALFLAWSLASPLFTNVTVEEEFPFALNAVVPEGMEREDVEMVMAGMAMVDDPVMEEAMPSAVSITAGTMLGSGMDAAAMGADGGMAVMEGMMAAASPQAEVRRSPAATSRTPTPFTGAAARPSSSPPPAEAICCGWRTLTSPTARRSTSSCHRTRTPRAAMRSSCPATPTSAR